MAKRMQTTKFEKGEVVTAGKIMRVLASANENDEVKMGLGWTGKVESITVISVDPPQGATLEEELRHQADNGGELF